MKYQYLNTIMDSCMPSFAIKELIAYWWGIFHKSIYQRTPEEFEEFLNTEKRFKYLNYDRERMHEAAREYIYFDMHLEAPRVLLESGLPWDRAKLLAANGTPELEAVEQWSRRPSRRLVKDVIEELRVLCHPGIEVDKYIRKLSEIHLYIERVYRNQLEKEVRFKLLSVLEQHAAFHKLDAQLIFHVLDTLNTTDAESYMKKAYKLGVLEEAPDYLETLFIASGV